MSLNERGWVMVAGGTQLYMWTPSDHHGRHPAEASPRVWCPSQAARSSRMRPVLGTGLVYVSPFCTKGQAIHGGRWFNEAWIIYVVVKELGFFLREDDVPLTLYNRNQCHN